MHVVVLPVERRHVDADEVGRVAHFVARAVGRRVAVLVRGREFLCGSGLEYELANRVVEVGGGEGEGKEEDVRIALAVISIIISHTSLLVHSASTQNSRFAGQHVLAVSFLSRTRSRSHGRLTVAEIRRPGEGEWHLDFVCRNALL